MNIDIDIEVEGYTQQVEAYLGTVVRPALAAGLNAAAELVRQDLVKELQQDIEDPTPFTLRAFGVMKAVPRDGKDIDALVFIRDAQAEYLHFQIDGGVRRAGDYGTTKTGAIAPGPHAPVDRYGNLPRGYIAKTLADPHVGWTTMRKRTGYTALVRNVPGGRPQLLAFIMPEIDYQPSFDFYDTAVRSAEKHVPGTVGAALDAAVRGADSGN